MVWNLEGWRSGNESINFCGSPLPREVLFSRWCILGVYPKSILKGLYGIYVLNMLFIGIKIKMEAFLHEKTLEQANIK